MYYACSALANREVPILSSTQASYRLTQSECILLTDLKHLDYFVMHVHTKKVHSLFFVK